MYTLNLMYIMDTLIIYYGYLNTSIYLLTQKCTYSIHTSLDEEMYKTRARATASSSCDRLRDHRATVLNGYGYSSA